MSQQYTGRVVGVTVGYSLLVEIDPRGLPPGFPVYHGRAVLFVAWGSATIDGVKAVNREVVAWYGEHRGRAVATFEMAEGNIAAKCDFTASQA